MRTILPVTDFPITWEQPADRYRFWKQDVTHHPGSVTPMTATFLRYVYEDGFNIAAQAYGLPVRTYTCCFNTYFYTTMIPVGFLSEQLLRLISWIREKSPQITDKIFTAAISPQNKRIQAKLEVAMASLAHTWNNEFLPEIKQHLAYWENFDLGNASLSMLLLHLDETIVRTKHLWELHFRILFPTDVARSMFDELYCDLFGNLSAFDAYRLLQGFDNKLLEADRGLWHLSRKAAASAQLRQIFEQRASNAVLAELEKCADGQAFLSEFYTYLRQYGYRGDKLYELSEPSWQENPGSVISILREYIAYPERDPASEIAALVTERERLVGEARERLKSYSQAVVDRFEFLLKAAQEAAIISEDHNFWIDICNPYHVRRVLMECGKRLAAAKVLSHSDDVFYLTIDELREMVSVLPRFARHELVTKRRDEISYFNAITPPPILGVLPPLPNPDIPLVRAFNKVLGIVPQTPSEIGIVRGSAASPGKAQGPARLVRSPSDIDKLEKGDVMIAEATTTSWTPLFSIAAAVVTDTGGILSHGAIVAREYGLPAVVGTGRATTIIKEGQMVEVDGNTGVVQILESGGKTLDQPPESQEPSALSVTTPRMVMQLSHGLSKADEHDIPLILALESSRATLEWVGGKGTSLALMAAASLPVPSGFHITTATYRRFVSENNLYPAILEAVNGATNSDPAALSRTAAHIRLLFEGGTLSNEIILPIQAAYASLGIGNIAVAVRSSATAEDLPNMSFAGQQETYLNIQGEVMLLNAVKRCWASLWTAGAISYRARQGVADVDVSLAVVVQQLISADAAGILFTANPINGVLNQVVINAAWGLGDAVVSGLVTPDIVVVDKLSGVILKQEISDKAVMTVCIANSTRKQLVPDFLRRHPVLSSAQVSALTRFGVRIEQLFGRPMDIEWVRCDGQLFIVQARPITALPESHL